ncbi:MAG: hypothetical protein AAB567_03525 [Patescibacteria group bacterium]
MSKTLVIGIVVVVVGIFILGGFLLWQMQPSPPPAQPAVQQTLPPPASPSPSEAAPIPEPQAEVLDTSDWQTYRNEGPSLSGATEPQGEFGFEVRYPGDWFNIQAETKWHAFSNSRDDLSYTNPNTVVIGISPEDIYDFMPGFFETLRNQEADKTIEARSVIYTKISNEEIAGFPGIRYEGDYRNISAASGLFAKREEVLIKKSDQIMLHFQIFGVSEQEVERNKIIFDQILTTFRFVERESSSIDSYILASPDGFSLQVNVGGKLYAAITRTQIENEFKKKYPTSSLGIGYHGFSYVGSPPSFFWDQKRRNLIFPISFEQVSGSSKTWDFFVFQVDSKRFFIIPEKRLSPLRGIVPSIFEASPDGNKFAYIAGGAGGTCTLHQYLAVLELGTFKSLNLDESEVQLAKEKNQIQDWDIYQDVKEFNWISNDQMRAIMFFGCDYPVQEIVKFSIIANHM